MKYQILYVDPPWDYNDRKSKDPRLGGFKYNTLNFKELYDLGPLIQNIMDKNSMLFLWVTLPKLFDVYTDKKTQRKYNLIDIIENWGFKYTTTAFVWVKLNPTGSLIKQDKDILIKKGIYSGLGHWTNGNAELVLMCKRGKPQRVAKNVKQIVIEPRTKHSKKPEIIRKYITDLLGELPRLELFARTTAEGWDTLGNEINGQDIKISLKKLAQKNL